MAAPVAKMQEVRNREVGPNPDLKNSNAAESRMDTPIQNNAIENRPSAKQFKSNPSTQDSQETENSQSTVDTNNETTASTPPTSDGSSSQSQESQSSQLSVVATAQQDPQNITFNVPPPGLSAAPSTSGQKRTASGMIKSSVAKSSMSPVVGSNGGHARSISNISSASNSSSRIGEKAAELRARLSYAMIKVNNGWQALPIEEVESLASQAASPTSSTSTLQGRRNRITSPRATIASLQADGATSRPFSSSAPVLGASNSLASLTTDQPSRTYESFWREHSVNTVPTHRQSAFQPHPSLAPPVDITSSHNHHLLGQHPRRTVQQRGTRPPVMPIHTVSDLSQSSTASPHTPTKEPPPPIEAMIPTQSQKSIKEQDAIDTLIFMSSPGNSQNLLHTFPPPPPQSNQQSPLRSEFNAASLQSSGGSQKLHKHHVSSGSNNVGINRIRKVGFRGDESGGGGGNRGSLSAAATRRRSGDEVDRMLDRMEDGSSDEDEIEIVPMRRAIGGR